MSFSGSSASRCRSWATTRLAISSLISPLDEHDALAQQPRVDVERALAARVLLDDHRDQWHVQPPSCGLPCSVAYVQPCELLECHAVRREVVLPVDAERAWELITDPRELEGWLADDGRARARGGRAVRVEWEDGERREGVVEEVERGPPDRASCGARSPRASSGRSTPCPAAPASSSPSAALAPVVGPAHGARSAAHASPVPGLTRARARRGLRRARRPDAPPGRALARRASRP